MLRRVRDLFGIWFIPLVLLGSIATVVYLSNRTTQLEGEIKILNTRLKERDTTADEVAKAVEVLTLNINKDHDTQILYMECIVSLFTRERRPTREDFNACLKGTRLEVRQNHNNQSEQNNQSVMVGNNKSNQSQSQETDMQRLQPTAQPPTPEEPKQPNNPNGPSDNQPTIPKTPLDDMPEPTPSIIDFIREGFKNLPIISQLFN